MSTSTEHSVLTRQREGYSALWIALGLSVVLHVPLLLAVPHSIEHEEPQERTDFDAAKKFSVSVVQEEEEQREEDEEELEGQFISAPPPAEEQRPDEARFRDQYDSKTDREMARQSPSTNSDMPANNVRDQGGRADQVRPEGNETSPDPFERRQTSEKTMRRASRQQTEPVETGESPEKTQAEQQEPTSGSEQQDAEKAEAEEGLVQAEDAGETKKSVDPQELFPSYADASGVAGGGGSVDYMRDVPEGNKNLLNRKRSRYWSFMDRIRRQVVQHWSPVAEYRKRDPTGDVYGVKDKVSILGVTLNGDGSVRKIYVSHPSGLNFYDDEAVRAIRAAAPFPNPPEGIKDQDGLIHFNFMFVLNIDSGGGPLLRIRRR